MKLLERLAAFIVAITAKIVAMSITPEELQQFHEFAEQRLNDAESLADLVVAWEKLRGHRASLDALRRSNADDDAGDLVTTDEAFSSVRSELGL